MRWKDDMLAIAVRRVLSAGTQRGRATRSHLQMIVGQSNEAGNVRMLRALSSFWVRPDDGT